MTGVADGITAVALPLLAAGLTGHPPTIAGVMAIQHLPWVVAEYAGEDLRAHGDRRTVVGLANTLRALVAVLLGGLSLVNKESIPVIYLAALILGVGEALTDEAEDETLDVLLDAAAASDARSTLRSRGMTGLALVGLPLGGLLYNIAAAAPFMLSMVTYAVAGLLALGVHTAVHPRTDFRRPARREQSHQQGVPHSARAVIAVASIAAGATSACLSVFVLYATDTLALDAPTFGMVLAGFAAGSYLGSRLAPWVGESLGIATGIGASMATTGLGYGLTSLFAGQSAQRAIPFLVLSSTGAMCAGVLLRATFQGTFIAAGRTVDTAALRSFHLATWSAIVLGALTGGILVETSGFPTLFLVMAGLAVAGGALATTLRVSPSTSTAGAAGERAP